MHDFPFLETVETVPSATDADAAARIRERWLEAFADGTNGGEDDDAGRARAIDGMPTGSALLDAIFGNSPFLSQCAVSDPDFLCDLLQSGPTEAFSTSMASLADKGKESLNEQALARELRLAKRRVALGIAVADITGAWPLFEITGALSRFAETALSLACGHALRTAAADGAFRLQHEDDPERDSGFVILGMGKLGARELNYSSDIDLIVLFDPTVIETDVPDRLQKNMIRITRTIVKLMDERTADGYVFRTDLRLRPDPGATPIALSTLAAETYYESLGQNWERAAMIKARPVAGDIAAGERFLKWLSPFIWRKNLDFAAIQDIHSIKRQINAHRAGDTLEVPGHNVKLGRGGIREIEFFAQTQQLIWGGREPDLRSPMTLDAIRALADFGLCDAGTVTALSGTYAFLRTVEHRLQMTNDEQTQTLPDDEAGLEHLALFLGYERRHDFEADMQRHLETVHAIYGRLFADAPSLGAGGEAAGNLVFTGGEPDPETLKTIETLGYANAETVDATIRGWHHGRYRAMRSTRARELLTELMPELLSAIAGTPDPDATFLAFDSFLAGLPAGVQLFTMFQAHPQLLGLVAEIMGKAPRLARHLSRRPSVLDSVLAPDFFAGLPDHETLQADLADQLARTEFMEDVLDTSRRWANDRRFQVGVHRLRNLTGPQAASAALSDIAETALQQLLPPVSREFEDQHGKITGARIAILAFGKLGSREMTASSDLDLVFVYDTPDENPQSDGPWPLYATQYFARLCQRFINAVTALTSEGSLYEVDMRLRPSGNSGPLATTLPAFEKYQAASAWTWEHMALTRARVIVADAGFRAEIESVLRAVLTRPRDRDKLLADVAAMRERLAREKPAECLWSLKRIRGGIIDIEFIAQYLMLKHAAEYPDVLDTNTAAALTRLGEADCLAPRDTQALLKALRLWQGLQGMLSLTIEDEMNAEREAEMSDALKADLAHIAEAATFQALEDRVKSTAEQVYDIFGRIIEDPAADIDGAA